MSSARATCTRRDLSDARWPLDRRLRLRLPALRHDHFAESTTDLAIREDRLPEPEPTLLLRDLHRLFRQSSQETQPSVHLLRSSLSPAGAPPPLCHLRGFPLPAREVAESARSAKEEQRSARLRLLNSQTQTATSQKRRWITKDLRVNTGRDPADSTRRGPGR